MSNHTKCQKQIKKLTAQLSIQNGCGLLGVQSPSSYDLDTENSNNSEEKEQEKICQKRLSK